MKLRIRGNSVRLRLSKSELERMATEGFAEDCVRFPAGPALRYRVEVAAQDALAASYSASLMTVTVPEAEMRRWLEPEQVSMRGEQRLDGGEVLKILVEKDFECLAPRPDEDEDGDDLFANPLANR